MSAACTGTDADDAETEGPPARRLDPIDTRDPGDLDAIALRLEDMVAVGDVGGVEDMWLRPEQLRGCKLGEVELPNAALEEFLETRHEGFVKRAKKTFARRWSGTLVYTRVWSGRREIMGERLRGDDCPADAFGRVWVYVRRGGKPRLVEHRFNLERVDGQWWIFHYQALRANCDEEGKWADGPMCDRLAHSRPEHE